MSAYREFCISRTVICWLSTLTADTHYVFLTLTFFCHANVLSYYPFASGIGAAAAFISSSGNDNGGSDDDVNDKVLLSVFVIIDTTVNN